MARQVDLVDQFAKEIVPEFIVEQGPEAIGSLVDLHPVLVLIDASDMRQVLDD